MPIYDKKHRKSLVIETTVRESRRDRQRWTERERERQTDRQRNHHIEPAVMYLIFL